MYVYVYISIQLYPVVKYNLVFVWHIQNKKEHICVRSKVRFILKKNSAGQTDLYLKKV